MKRTITVPDSWDEVSVGQFQEMCATEKDYERVSIVLDEDPEDVRKYSPESMARVIAGLSWIKKFPDESKYLTVIEVDGKEYFLIKNLQSFSLGEMVDMEEYLKDYNENLHLILAMLYRPAGEYRAEDVQGRADLFKEKLMIGQVYGATVFFSLVERKSILIIQHFLSQELLRKTKRQKKKENGWLRKRLQKNGVGIITPTA